MRNLEHIKEYIAEFGNSEDDESRRMLSFVINALASNILHIDGHDSDFVSTLSPAMFLYMMATVRKSNFKESTDDRDKEFICGLAVDYVEHHQTELDSNYFDALMSELYFPKDTKEAADVAISLLEIAESNGWVKHCSRGGSNHKFSLVDMCTAVISRYTLESGSAQVRTLYQKLPKDVICRVLGIVLAAKNAMMVLQLIL